MNLQLALDRLSKEECFNITDLTSEYVDWIEVGTGVIKEYGMQIIREMKARYPDKTIVADMKTCDAGKSEAIQAFDAGADVTTVMAFAADKTILDTLEIAKNYGKMVVVDLLGVSNPERIKVLQEMQVEYVSPHIGKDLQEGNTSIKDQFDLISSFSNFKIAVAGGINLKSLPLFLSENPDVIIVGSSITKAENPKEVAFKIKEMMNNHYEKNNKYDC